MKTFKKILKWYSIGIIVTTFILIMLITERVSNGVNIYINKYHNIPQIIFGFGAFFGLLAYVVFGQPQNKE